MKTLLCGSYQKNDLTSEEISTLFHINQYGRLGSNNRQRSEAVSQNFESFLMEAEGTIVRWNCPTIQTIVCACVCVCVMVACLNSKKWGDNILSPCWLPFMYTLPKHSSIKIFLHLALPPVVNVIFWCFSVSILSLRYSLNIYRWDLPGHPRWDFTIRHRILQNCTRWFREGSWNLFQPWAQISRSFDLCLNAKTSSVLNRLRRVQEHAILSHFMWAWIWTSLGR